jgi:hypothetical protein
MTTADKQAPAGQAALKQAQEMQDEIIALYTKAVALAMDDPQLAPLVTQARPSLELHYKSRKGSLDGLDAAIQAAKTP